MPTRKPKRPLAASKALTKVDKQVAANLAELMLNKRVSDKDLAKALGTQRHQVQKYRHGVNRISAGKLWEIAVALDEPILSMFHGVA